MGKKAELDCRDMPGNDRVSRSFSPFCVITRFIRVIHILLLGRPHKRTMKGYKTLLAVRKLFVQIRQHVFNITLAQIFIAAFCRHGHA